MFVVFAKNKKKKNKITKGAVGYFYYVGAIQSGRGQSYTYQYQDYSDTLELALYQGSVNVTLTDNLFQSTCRFCLLFFVFCIFFFIAILRNCTYLYFNKIIKKQKTHTHTHKHTQTHTKRAIIEWIYCQIHFLVQ